MKRAFSSRAVRDVLPVICAVLAAGRCACGGPQPNALGSIVPIATAQASEAAADEDTGHGDSYSYHIRYPALDQEWTTLSGALHEYATIQKKDFLGSAK